MFIKQLGHGVEKKTPIVNFDLKLKVLEHKPGLVSGVINEVGEKVNDEVLAGMLINKTGDLSKEKSSMWRNAEHHGFSRG